MPLALPGFVRNAVSARPAEVGDAGPSAAQSVVARFMQTSIGYPPRVEPADSTVDDIMASVQGSWCELNGTAR